MNKTEILVFVFHWVFDLLYLASMIAVSIKFNNYWLLLLLFFLPSITCKQNEDDESINIYEIMHKAYLTQESIQVSLQNIKNMWVWDCKEDKYVKFIGYVANGFVSEGGEPYPYEEKRYMLYEPIEIRSEVQEEDDDKDAR